MELFSSKSYCDLDGKRFDFLKIILSIFIVAIHTTPVGSCSRPIIRIAVPLFFIMTSYFFFLHQNNLKSMGEKKIYLLKYVRRILRLYAFWFVALLPISVVCKKWYLNIDFETVINIIRSFLFGSTFRASWFLMASLINVLFVWYASQKISNYCLFALGLFMYFLCCIFSNYYYFIDNIFLIEVYHKYVSIISPPFNSFPVALLFVMLGKYLADKPVLIPNNQLLLLLVLSIVLLYVEFYLIEAKMCELYSNPNQLFRSDDSYFFLIPSSLLIFIFVGQNYVRISSETKDMRKCSTVVYCCHYSIAAVINFILTKLGMGSNSFILFFITLFFSIIVFFIIDYYAKKDNLYFLKWSY